MAGIMAEAIVAIGNPLDTVDRMTVQRTAQDGSWMEMPNAWQV